MAPTSTSINRKMMAKYQLPLPTILLLRPKRWIRTLKWKTHPENKTQPVGQDYTLLLPAEILVTIFGYLGRNSKSLTRVTAVCKRWRAISIQTAYLWTCIEVVIDNPSKNDMKALLARVELFLDRTSNLLLDVKWVTCSDKDTRHVQAFYDLFREKGPFCRWKCLCLGLKLDVTHDFGERRGTEKFTNLKCLRIQRRPPAAYVELIADTVTDNLCTLELATNVRCRPELSIHYDKILSYITTLKVEKGAVPPPTGLPPNVTQLEAWTLPNFPITHISDLVVRYTPSISSISTHDFSNVVRLYMYLPQGAPREGQTVTFPEVRWLTVQGGSLSTLSAIRAPNLHTLIIRGDKNETQTVDGSLITALRNGFDASTVTVLKIRVLMDGPAFCELLQHFSQMEFLSITVDAATTGREMLAHAFPAPGHSITTNGSVNHHSARLKRLWIVSDKSPGMEYEWADIVKTAAHSIGDPFSRISVHWPGGRYRMSTTRSRTPDWPTEPEHLERNLGMSPWA